MGAGEEQSKRIRSKIQASIEQAQQEHKRELFRRRIELARNGVKAYQARRMGDAVKFFHTYIRILEEWKSVSEGGLHPGLFDAKKDVSELLLITGVYWDLVKLYDRTKSATRQSEFKHYMEKYILFSRGMSYQPLCSETLRKYISNEKPVHRDDFKNAYRLVGDSKCFVATSLVDLGEPDTVPRLRRFRDEVLMPNIAGRVFVRWYYRHGEWMASRVDRLPEGARRALAKGLDRFAELI